MYGGAFGSGVVIHDEEGETQSEKNREGWAGLCNYSCERRGLVHREQKLLGRHAPAI